MIFIFSYMNKLLTNLQKLLLLYSEQGSLSDTTYDIDTG